MQPWLCPLYLLPFLGFCPLPHSVSSSGRWALLLHGAGGSEGPGPRAQVLFSKHAAMYDLAPLPQPLPVTAPPPRSALGVSGRKGLHCFKNVQKQLVYMRNNGDVQRGW